MTADTNTQKSFWQKSNDPQSREWPYRLSRFVRASIYRWCGKIMLLAEDPRSLQALKKGWDPYHYIRLRRWHDQGFQPKVVYDIGAYEGGWAEMCQCVFSPAQCFLFEPQPDYQSRAKARQPTGANWQVLPVALGDSDQTQRMFLTENEAASSILAPRAGEVPTGWGTKSIARQEVPVATLDGLVSKNGLPLPDLVKIDVQGYEGRVFTGGKNVLSQAQRIIVEVSLHPIYDDQSLLPEVASTLSSWGFEIEDMNEACREWVGRLWQTDLWCKRIA